MSTDRPGTAIAAMTGMAWQRCHTNGPNDRLSGEPGEFPVIARSEATKQSPTRKSRRTRRAGDCFVASLLAVAGGRCPPAYVSLFGTWYHTSRRRSVGHSDGFVYADGRSIAVYFVSWTRARRPLDTNIDWIPGEWGEGATPTGAVFSRRPIG